jgi:hypothetical protein
MGESFLIQKLIQSDGSVNYINYVAQDLDGAKYVVYNGYDFITNPTPGNNFSFNQWILNNSATGNVILNNTIMSIVNYNGPSTTINESNMSILSYTPTISVLKQPIAIGNGFFYVSGGTSNNISKYNETSLSFVGNTAGFLNLVRSLLVNNGFIYALGIYPTTNLIRKYNADTLAFVSNSPNINIVTNHIFINNGFIYVSNGSIRKYNEQTLEFVGNSANLNLHQNLVSLNGNLYVTSQNSLTTINANATRQNYAIYRINEVTLENTGATQIGNVLTTTNIANDTVTYSGNQTSGNVIASGNNLIFVSMTRLNYSETFNDQFFITGFQTGAVRIVYPNLVNYVYIGGTNGFGTVPNLAADNKFVYLRRDEVISKYRHNGQFIANALNNAGNFGARLALNNVYIYTGTNNIFKLQQNQVIPDVQTYYKIKDIKED